MIVEKIKIINKVAEQNSQNFHALCIPNRTKRVGFSNFFFSFLWSFANSPSSVAINYCAKDFLRSHNLHKMTSKGWWYVFLVDGWAEDEKCITGECVHYTCEMRQEEPIEEPIEVQRTTEYTNDWTQVSGRRKVGTAKRTQPPPDPVTTRKIPDGNTWAKPLRSDTRHTIRLRPSIGGYDELTVFLIFLK